MWGKTNYSSSGHKDAIILAMLWYTFHIKVGVDIILFYQREIKDLL